MQRTENVEIPAVPPRTAEKVVATLCDLCGKAIIEDSFDVDDVTIQHRVGYSCSGGSDIATAVFDVCGMCWTTTVVPWFASKSAKPRREECNW